MSEARASVAATARALALPLAALYLVALGAAPLFDVDEGAFAEATREMLQSGDWGHTTLNGADRFDKPILVYWLQAAAMTLFGVNEFAARLPSALATMVACIATAHVAGRRLGAHAGVLSGLVLASTAGFMLIGRAATADGLLNALLIATSLCLWQFALDRDLRALRWAALWCGLGLLTKGPIALLVPGATLILWAASQRDGALLWRALTDLRSWAIVVIVAGPWYLYALMRHGMRFVEGFLLRHNVERFAGTLEGHSGSLLYYIVVLPLLLLPWTPLLLCTVMRWRSLWAAPHTRFLLVWSAFVIVFFSLSGTKLPHYALYGVAPLAMLAGLALASAGARRWQQAVWATALLQLGALALAPWLTGLLANRTGDAWVRAILVEASNTATFMPWVLLGVALVLVLALWPVVARNARLHIGAEHRTVMAACVAAAVLAWLAVPWWANAQQGPVRDLGVVARERDLSLVQWRLHQPSIGFYADRAAPRTAPAPGQWALVNTLQSRQQPTVVCERMDGRSGYALVRASDRPWPDCFNALER